MGGGQEEHQQLVSLATGLARSPGPLLARNARITPEINLRAPSITRCYKVSTFSDRLGALSRVIGGERERRSRAPGNYTYIRTTHSSGLKHVG